VKHNTNMSGQQGLLSAPDLLKSS